MPSSNQPGLLRFRNARAVLLALLRGRRLSRADLARELSISRPTVLDIVDRFVENGVLTEVGTNASGGRPGVALSVAADAGEIVAIDLGGSSVRLGRFDLHGTLLDRLKVPTDTSSRDAVLDQIAALVAGHSRAGRERTLVIGAPGYVRDGVVCDAPNLPEWHDVPLRADLERRLGVPVIVENDVDLAAVGESRHGVGRDHRNLVFLSLGTGLGCGIVLNGRLVRGAAGAAGEIGFLVPGVTELEGDFGANGALETLAAMPALVGHLPAGSAHAGTSPEEVIAAARAGDRDAREAVRVWARYVALGVLALGAICNPGVVVIGGAGMHAFDLLEGPLTDAMHRHLPAPPALARTALGDDAALWGGLALGRERVVEVLATRQRSDMPMSEAG